MTTSPIEREPVRALSIEVREDALIVLLDDGRTVSAPLDWYPRLAHASPAERDNWRMIGSGEGIHWPDLDEDVRVTDLLRGIRSGESTRSLERWLSERRQRRGA